MQKYKTPFLVGSVIVIAFFYYFLISPAFALYNISKQLPEKIKPLQATITGTASGSDISKDLAFLTGELEYFKEYLLTAKVNVDRMSVFSILPFFGNYIKDARVLVNSSISMLDTSNELFTSIESTIPNLNFEGWGSITDDTANKSSLKEISSTLATQLPKYKLTFEKITKDLNTINENRYPEKFKNFKLKEGLRDLKYLSTVLSSSFDNLVKVVGLLPEFTGDTETKNYLVLLQNDKQLRPSGGVITAYAVFRVSNGSLKIVKSGDVLLLNNDLKNASYSPDFQKSATKIIDEWSKTPDSYPINGIIAVDTHFISSLIDIIGSVKTNELGVVDNTNIVEKLLSFSNVAGGTTLEDKKNKGAVSALLFELLHKSFSADLQKRLTFAKTVISEVSQKHALFYFLNGEVQNIANEYDITGTVKDFNGDYLNIINTNTGGVNVTNEVKLKVKKTIEQKDETYKNTLVITYENTSPSTNYSYLLNVYVPLGSTLTSGSDEFSQSEDLRKTVFTKNVSLQAGQTLTLSLLYDLPQRLINSGSYNLLLQKQAGVDTINYTLDNFGKIMTLDLKEDKLLKIKR